MVTFKEWPNVLLCGRNRKVKVIDPSVGLQLSAPVLPRTAPICSYLPSLPSGLVYRLLHRPGRDSALSNIYCAPTHAGNFRRRSHHLALGCDNVREEEGDGRSVGQPDQSAVCGSCATTICWVENWRIAGLGHRDGARGPPPSFSAVPRCIIADSLLRSGKRLCYRDRRGRSRLIPMRLQTCVFWTAT